MHARPVWALGTRREAHEINNCVHLPPTKILARSHPGRWTCPDGVLTACRPCLCVLTARADRRPARAQKGTRPRARTGQPTRDRVRARLARLARLRTRARPFGSRWWHSRRTASSGYGPSPWYGELLDICGCRAWLTSPIANMTGGLIKSPCADNALAVCRPCARLTPCWARAVRHPGPDLHGSACASAPCPWSKT